MALDGSDQHEGERWEPPRRTASAPEWQWRASLPAGLRLDVGWLVMIRLAVAAVFLLATAMPDRAVVLTVIGIAATLGVVASFPGFRLPLRLRHASLVESLGLGCALPFAVVQAAVGQVLELGDWRQGFLLVELGVANVLVMLTAALLAERRSDIWGPLARVLVLWPTLLVPVSLVPGTVGRVDTMTLVLGGGYLTAAVLTLIARLTPLRTAPLVVVAGTLFYGFLVLSSAGLARLATSPALWLTMWGLQLGVALVLLFGPVRQRLLWGFLSIRSRLGPVPPSRSEDFSRQADRD